MRKVLVLLPLLRLAVELPGGAQMQPGSLTRTVTIKVKPGMAPQFEYGLKEFHQWENRPSVLFAFHA